MALCTEAIATAAEVDDDRAAAEALVALSTEYMLFDCHEAAARAATAALARFEPPEAERWQAEAWSLLGAVRRAQGRTEEAMDHARRVIAVAREVGSPVIEATAQNNLGLVLYATGAHDWALTHYLAALALIEPFDTPDSLQLRIVLSANVADLHAEARDYQRSAEHNAVAIELLRRVENPILRGAARPEAGGEPPADGRAGCRADPARGDPAAARRAAIFGTLIDHVHAELAQLDERPDLAITTSDGRSRSSGRPARSVSWPDSGSTWRRCSPRRATRRSTSPSRPPAPGRPTRPGADPVTRSSSCRSSTRPGATWSGRWPAPARRRRSSGRCSTRPAAASQAELQARFDVGQRTWEASSTGARTRS